MKKSPIMLALLACVSIGTMLAAEQTPASTQAGHASSTMSGTLTAKQGKFFLTDEATRSTVEVRGEGLKKYAGKQVNLTGELMTGSGGSPQVLIVSEVSVKAAGLGSSAAAAGVKSGLSKAAVVGLAGGATAATVGSLYATDVIGDNETSVSRK